MNIFNVAIIGVGRLGGALALALSEKKYNISQLVSRNHEKANRIAELLETRPQILKPEEIGQVEADVAFITTQDSEIPKVVKSLVDDLEHLPYIFHTSGSLSSKILNDLSREGCEVASFHPLISISDAKSGAKHFKNAYFCVEGDSEAVIAANQIVRDLEGIPFSVGTKDKTLYHAAAVTASGHLVALISIAVEILSKCGLSEAESQQILFPLIDSTVQNLAVQPPAAALTGTFARADVETLQNHLETLRENVAPEILETYIDLGRRSLELARQQGANELKLKEMKEILDAPTNRK